MQDRGTTEIAGISTPIQSHCRDRGFSRVLGTLLLGVGLALTGGCATHARRLQSARGDFYSGRLDEAHQQLQQAIDRDDRDVDVLMLDQAVVELWRGHPQQAERLLVQVRDRFDYLEQRDITEAAVALATDDTRRAYAGEDYEKVLIRVMLALANLMDDGEDVAAYAFQINQKQQQIIDRLPSPPPVDSTNDLETQPVSPSQPAVANRDKTMADATSSPEQVAREGSQEESTHGAGAEESAAVVDPRRFFKQLALGPYLHGVVREATHANYDDAERSYAKVVEWAPDFSQGVIDLTRARDGHHSAPGNGVVYLVALIGKGPFKQESLEVPTSQALLVADRILSAMGEHGVTPTLAPIKVPIVRQPQNPLDRLAVRVDAGDVYQTEVLTNLGQIALEQSKARYGETLGRAVARRTVKKAAMYATKTAVSSQGWTEAALDLVGVAWEASESADTRSWGLLPETIQVLRIELPVGSHTLELQPAVGEQLLGEADTVEVTIADGRNTYLMVHYPGLTRVGDVLVSSPR